MSFKKERMKFCRLPNRKVFHGKNNGYHWYSVKKTGSKNPNKAYELHQVNHLYQYDPERAKRMLRDDRYREFRGPSTRLWEPSGLNKTTIYMSEEQYKKAQEGNKTEETWNVVFRDK